MILFPVIELFHSRQFCISVVVVTLMAAISCKATVDFPGPMPRTATSTRTNNVFSLENNVISASWQLVDGQLRPFRLDNRLTGNAYNQSGEELFRLALIPPAKKEAGVVVAVRLETNRVVVIASYDSSMWTELASFPRTNFPGQPKLVRLGKMNLQAQAKDYDGEAGMVGRCTIGEFSLAKTGQTNAFVFNSYANKASVEEFPFPSDTNFVSCRIDKGTDQGQSWGPAMALIWKDEKKFLLVGVRYARSPNPIFNITTEAGENTKEGFLVEYPAMDTTASAFRVSGPPKIVHVTPAPNSSHAPERVGGVAIEAQMVSSNGIRADWRAELRDGSSYIRQTVKFSSAERKIPLYAIELADVRIPSLKTIGSVPGSPIAGDGMYFGVEMPGTWNAFDDGGARIALTCQLELSPTQQYSFGSVAGVYPEGQLRRAFLYYIERERARPSSPFLHYNSWYDLGYSMDAAKLIAVVKAFNTQLVNKRGVQMQSYLIDDGWDNPDKGLWMEDTNKFPGGFAALKTQMAALNAHLGIWISPMGGSLGFDKRVIRARKMGIIPKGSRFDFAYPSYKEWFQNRCLQLMREDGVNIIKWDHAGQGVSPHFMAALDIARNLHKENPEVFINATLGTWPSPFWLNFVDSIWRNGSADVWFAGKGNDREQWLTYRDGYCYKSIVERGPLFPLNSVMHHGIVNGQRAQGARIYKSGTNLKHEVRSYFANGTSLQELYITPSLMAPEAWDDLAAAAKWANTNADVLVDSHWIGGDPFKLDVYGYAAWCPRQGTLMIRNPDDQPQVINLDASSVFELPENAAKRYLLRSPYADQRLQSLILEAGDPKPVKLDPFEVLVFDAWPEKQ